LWAELNRIALTYRWVDLAAFAAEHSERDRFRLKQQGQKQPRSGAAPAGWSLGRRILLKAGFPEHRVRAYLPARRDEWPAGRKFMTTLDGNPLRLSRLDASVDAQSKAYGEKLELWDEYYQSIQRTGRAWLYALAAGVDRKKVGRLQAAYEKSKKKHRGKRKRAERATAKYEQLMSGRKTVLLSGEKVELPRERLSNFWTAAIKELASLYRPFTDKMDIVANQWLRTPTRVVRLTLVALVPTEHRDTRATDLWDRLPNS
jgi:hypothetical protein